MTNREQAALHAQLCDVIRNGKPETVLVLRSCKPDLVSYNGFKWPENGPVECPDWDNKPKCGHGLHGLLWGQGDQLIVGDILTDKWLVVEVLAKDVVKIGGGQKVKFPKGNVIFCGDYLTAEMMICKKLQELPKTNSGKSVSGDCGKSVSGDYGKSVSGDCGKSVSGYYGKSVSGNCGSAKAGENGLIILCYFDSDRYRCVSGCVGENGIKADTWYILNEKHELTEAK